MSLARSSANMRRHGVPASKAAQRAECEKIFRDIVAEEGQRLLGWRTIPTNNGTLGQNGAGL